MPVSLLNFAAKGKLLKRVLKYSLNDLSKQEYYEPLTTQDFLTTAFLGKTWKANQN